MISTHKESKGGSKPKNSNRKATSNSTKFRGNTSLAK